MRPSSLQSTTCCRGEELVSALNAALEVNEHLRTDIELKTSRITDLRMQLAACERRCQQLSDKLKTCKHTPEVHAAENVHIVVCHHDHIAVHAQT